MGNRAVVIFDEAGTISPAIYLHWNGGPESVYAFLEELDSREVRADGDYDAARFVQIVGEFFDQEYHTGLSLGIFTGPTEITPEALRECELGDNGIYVVTRQAPKDSVAGKAFRTRGYPLVRRFAPVYDATWSRTGVQELTPGRVQRERREALKNKTYAAIREFFDRVRKPTESQHHRKETVTT